MAKNGREFGEKRTTYSLKKGLWWVVKGHADPSWGAIAAPADQYPVFPGTKLDADGRGPQLLLEPCIWVFPSGLSTTPKYD